ncbi:MAG: linear amide C-N hydrolase [Thermomicrobiales bacterium]
MRIHWLRSCLLVFALLVTTVGPAAACTGIVLTAKDGAVVRGRTLEFGNPLDSDVILIPRGFAMTGITPGGENNGLTWTAKYAAAGANGVGLPDIVDGLNEMGLGGGIFYFPGFAGYQDIADDERSQAIAPWQLMTWALTSFATIDEVKVALPKIKVGAVELAALGGVPPMHYFLTDATGKSIAVEYVDGVLTVYDDRFGVFTNAPAFDWHTTNLRNYINISPDPQRPVDLDDVNLDPFSTGGNLFGMPGDFSSPSRFVRAVVFSEMSTPIATGPDAVMQGFHILDNFDIPEGSVPEPTGSDPPYESTEWTTMSDLKALTFYIWTNDNRSIQTLDLSTLDLDGREIRTFDLDQPQTFIALGES